MDLLNFYRLQGGRMLIVLRGNSGSGKTTISKMLQSKLGPLTAVLQQDHFRRVIYHEKEQESMAHAHLLETAAFHCLSRGHHVILEGIFNASRYESMLERIASQSQDSRFYAFDLDFEETARRHATRPQAREFSVDQMRSWYHGWQPLGFVSERRITSDQRPDQIVERILNYDIKTI